MQNVSCPPSPVPCYGLSRPSASPAPKLQAPWRGAGSGGRFHERGREARRANTRASHPVNAAGCCQTQSASSDGVRISRARKAETRDTRACIHDRRAQDGAQPGLSRNVQHSSRGSAGANLESSPGSRCNRALPRCAVFVGEARLDSANGARTQPLLRTQPNFHHGVASAWKLSLVRQLPAAHTCAAQACICHYSFQTRHVHTCTPAHMNAHTRTHTHTCTCTYKYTPELEQGATMMAHGMRARDAGAHAGARLGRNSQPAVVATLRARQLSPHPARLSWLEAAECGDPFLRSHRPGLRQQRPAGHCCRRLHCLRCSSSLAAHRLRRRPAHAIRPTTHGCSAGDAHGIPAAGRGPAGPGAMVARGGRG